MRRIVCLSLVLLFSALLCVWAAESPKPVSAPKEQVVKNDKAGADTTKPPVKSDPAPKSAVQTADAPGEAKDGADAIKQRRVAVLRDHLRIGQPVPEFKVHTTSGMTVTPAHYRNDVLVIDFFAPWCKACKVYNMPRLFKLHDTFKTQGLHVLGLSVDEYKNQSLEEFAREQMIHYPLAVADNQLQSDFGVKSVPAVVVVDKQGRVAAVYGVLNHFTSYKLEKLVKRLLREDLL